MTKKSAKKTAAKKAATKSKAAKAAKPKKEKTVKVFSLNEKEEPVVVNEIPVEEIETAQAPDEVDFLHHQAQNIGMTRYDMTQRLERDGIDHSEYYNLSDIDLAKYMITKYGDDLKKKVVTEIETPKHNAHIMQIDVKDNKNKATAESVQNLFAHVQEQISKGKKVSEKTAHNILGIKK